MLAEHLADACDEMHHEGVGEVDALRNVYVHHAGAVGHQILGRRVGHVVHLRHRACSTRALVGGLTLSGVLTTRETVMAETPAALATSLTVAAGFSSHFYVNVSIPGTKRTARRPMVTLTFFLVFTVPCCLVKVNSYYLSGEGRPCGFPQGAAQYQLRLTGALGLILLSMGILGGEMPQRARETAWGAHPCVGPRSRRPSGALPDRRRAVLQ